MSPSTSQRFTLRQAQAIILALIVAMCGCTNSIDEVVPAGGAILLDGKPRSNVLIVFTPGLAAGTDNLISRAISDERGHFMLLCEDGRPGAMPGWHRVTVEDLSVYVKLRDEEIISPHNAVPKTSIAPAYNHLATTPLRIEVREETHGICLELFSDRDFSR